MNMTCVIYTQIDYDIAGVSILDTLFPSPFQTFVSQLSSNTEFVAANLNDEFTESSPFVLKNVSGIQVAFIGIVADAFGKIPFWSISHPLYNITYTYKDMIYYWLLGSNSNPSNPGNNPHNPGVYMYIYIFIYIQV